MKKTFTFLILISSFTCFSQTQAEMNQQAYDELNKSNKKLNEVFHKIKSIYKTDTLFLQNLKSSQIAWIKFRDAELEMKFPPYPNKHYGSIHPICRAQYLQELTQKRTKTLQNWVAGIEEGNACNGSINIIEQIDPRYMGKATIKENGSIWLTGNMKRDHRIFGFKNKDIHSEKMILLSIFTNEVENNPFNCKYGAYYDTSGMDNINLKYISTEDNFIKAAILKNKEKVDEVYMLRKWFEFKNE